MGLNTNIHFLDDLALHPRFESGNVNTGFIGEFYDKLFPKRTLCQGALALAMLLMEQQAGRQRALDTNGEETRETG